jgi:hypothetical protein
MEVTTPSRYPKRKLAEVKYIEYEFDSDVGTETDSEIECVPKKVSPLNS